MKKIAVLILILVISLFSVVSCGPSETTPDYTDPDNPVLGLTVDKNGTFLLDGTKVQAYGVNLFGVFCKERLWNPNYDIEKPFKSLRESGIRVVRTNMGPFYDTAFAIYMNSPEQYFEALDAVVAAAEKYEIGIFASLSWNITTIPDWVGEHMGYALGNKDSETIKLAKKYYTDVVSRYKDSPAIWAWEFGNEYNLGADLKSMQNVVGTSMPGIVRTEEDYYTSYDVSVFYTEVGKAIRKIDPYRAIVGGDSELSCRPAALRNKNSWEADDYNDIVESTGLYAPEPLSGVSSHFYHSNRYGQNLPDYSTDEADKTYDKWIKWGIDAAHELGKGYFVGEYGPGEALNNGKGTDEQWIECVKHLQDSFLRNDVQIALGWLCIDDFTTPDRLSKGLYREWYNSLVELNETLRSEGKQTNIDSYWEKAKATINIDDAAHKCTDHFMGMGNPAVVLSLNDYLTNFSNNWLGSSYETNAVVSVETSKSAEGTDVKIFRLSNPSSADKSMIKFSALSGLAKDGKYKLKFYLKTTDVSGDGIIFKFSAPTFYTSEPVKCDQNGEWQLIEAEIPGPAIVKSAFSFTITFENQAGTAEIYGLRLEKAG